PVAGRRPAHQHELVFPLAEDDVVADHVPIRRHRHEMLGAVQVKIGKIVDAMMGQEFLRIGAFDRQLVHVVRLVEQHGRMAPCPLLGPPVAEFGRDNRVYIHPDLGIAQPADNVRIVPQNVTKTGLGHAISSLALAPMYTYVPMAGEIASALRIRHPDGGSIEGNLQACAFSLRRQRQAGAKALRTGDADQRRISARPGIFCSRSGSWLKMYSRFCRAVRACSRAMNSARAPSRAAMALSSA